MVLRAGIEPARPEGHRIFLPTTTFAAYFTKKVICGLDFIFTFYLQTSSQAEAVKSLRFFEKMFSNLARYCHLTGFTEFDFIHTRVSSLCAQINLSPVRLPIPPPKHEKKISTARF